MEESWNAEKAPVHEALLRLTARWAADKAVDFGEGAELRQRAILLNHRHYRQNIALYRNLCERAGLGDEDPSIDFIARNLLLTDEIFKSYPQRLLDEGDYAGMNAWLSVLSDREISFDTAGIDNVDKWLSALAARGVTVVFSSGTSGMVSFVPRDGRTWEAFTRLPALYMPALLAERGVMPAWQTKILLLALKNLAPDTYLNLTHRLGLPGIDGFFCNFASGLQGIQIAGQQVAAKLKKAEFLYPANLSAAAVRAVVRGARTAEEADLADKFLSETVRKKEFHYHRLLASMEKSAKKGRRCLLFGAPYLLLELCERAKIHGMSIRLPKGSAAILGGGWKSFEGKRLAEDELYALITETFGLPKEAVVEGYSMTEIQAVMLKCAAGRYHVPPFLETLILDETLSPMEGGDITGVLAVLDPFAESYPGFLITGDTVRRVTGPCPCGRCGPAILTIARTPGREVKGCGGIMAKMNA